MNESRKILVEKVYAAIKDGSIVKDGKLPTEREMAALMTTSRTSMREALIVLETLGIIEVKGKQGLFVKDAGMGRLNQSLDLYATWPADIIPQIFQVRIMMESPAAGLAARNRTDADLAKMAECLAQFSRIFGEDGPDAGARGPTGTTSSTASSSRPPTPTKCSSGCTRGSLDHRARDGIAEQEPPHHAASAVDGAHSGRARADRPGDPRAGRDGRARVNAEASGDLAANLEKLCQDKESALLDYTVG